MQDTSIIKTKRLILRPWQEKDLVSFAAMNADPRVMEHFPSVKTFEESRQEYQRIIDHFTKHSWGSWAVSLIDGAEFIGFIGLRAIDFLAPFTPAVEVGWRLAFDYWGKGYATEGALASLQYGFEKLDLKEIISFTATSNSRSTTVMEKIGMHHNPADDFDHSLLAEGHRLRRHVLYRFDQAEWKTKVHHA
ncbi:MAG: rimL [Chlamydiia bacterium]|nr:rimL [Chlamydiia bacterium]